MKISKIVLFVILAGLITSSALLLFSNGTAEKGGRSGTRTVSIVSVPVEFKEFSDVVEALGTSKADESVTITSRVADIIKGIYFEDGDIVKKGQLLVELNSDEEMAEVQEAEANFDEAQKAYDRIRDLMESGNASNAALDSSRRALDEARYQLEADKARLADMKISAPFDGLLGLRQVSKGSYLTTATPITTIDAIDIIKLDFHVPERFIASLSKEQGVVAEVDAYPGALFSGVISTIDSRVDPVTRSVLVRAHINNEKRQLRPGMLMKVKVTSRVWKALSVPEESIVPAFDKKYVFINDNGIAHKREVSLGIRRPGYVEITSGLSEGERVVTQGAFRLGQEGQKVKELTISSDAVGGSAP